MKILVTHDFLSTKLLIHTPRLSNFLSPILNYLKCEHTFLSKEQAEKLEENLNIKRTGKMFTYVTESDLSNTATKHIVNFLKQYDVIIIFEATKTLKSLLNKNGITYIDIWLSPFRFSKDMMFSIASNDPLVQEKLDGYKINKEELLKHANIVKGHANNFLTHQEIILEKNSALLIGQLFQDKSVMKDGKFLTLLDFKDKLKELATNYNKIYFLKHPLMSQDDFSEILDGLSDITNIIYITKINTYYLLSQPEICDVIGLSSSVLIEAEYFHKKSIYLFRPILGPEFKTIYKNIYKTKFWKEILKINSNQNDIEYLVHDNYMRYSTGLYYGYSNFMNDFPDKREYKTITNLYRFCTELDRNKKYILYGYGSLGKLILPLIKESVTAIIDGALTQNTYIEGIPTIPIDELPPSSDVIITPYIYAEEIIPKLKEKECNYILPNRILAAE